MNKIWIFIWVIAIGMIFLTGCGDGQASGISSVQPVDVGGINTESNGQSDKEESGEQITLTLGAYETPWELTYAVDAYNARNGKYYVEIVDYGQKYPDYETAKERLKLDLATSKMACTQRE